MDWIKYPEFLPKEDIEYLVSLEGYVTIAKFEKRTKLYDECDEKYYAPAWHDLQEGGLMKGVDAFMDKPLPFINATIQVK